MAERLTHGGGCHCGAVRFEVDAVVDEVISCNCSICQKRGSLLAFAPGDTVLLMALAAISILPCCSKATTSAEKVENVVSPPRNPVITSRRHATGKSG